jgi:YggT family protein
MQLAVFDLPILRNSVYTIAWLFLIFLFARMVFEYVFIFARDYQPQGAVLVVVETVYTVTDPPLKLLRRFIPPLRLGSVAFDIAFIVLFLITLVVISFVAPKL